MAAVTTTRRVLGTLVILLALGACGNDPNIRRASEPVSPIAVGDPADVNAMALASAMIRAGFTREQILNLGPSIRRGLATNGGAQAQRDGRVAALFSHMDGRLYVTSESSGTFTVRI